MAILGDGDDNAVEVSATPEMVTPKAGASGDVPIKTGRLRTLGMKVKPGGGSFYFLAAHDTLFSSRYARRFPLTQQGWQEAWATFAAEDLDAARAYLEPTAGDPEPEAVPAPRHLAVPAMVTPNAGASGDLPIKTGRLRTLGMKVRGTSSFYFVARNEPFSSRYARRFPLTEEGWQAAWTAFAVEDPDAAHAWLDPAEATRAPAVPGAATAPAAPLPALPPWVPAELAESDFGRAVLSCLTVNYATFEGRASRAEYWWFVLFSDVTVFVLLVVGAVLPVVGIVSGLLALAVAVALFVPSIAVLVRRLHDTNRSGAYALLTLVPFVGPLIVLVLTLLEGDRGANQYGPPSVSLSGGTSAAAA